MTAAGSGGEGSSAVRVRGLRKRFGELVAVDGIDFEVRTGTCLGVLGPKGSGKTATTEMLEGLQRPDEGEVEILGMTWDANAAEIREAIGVQLQETDFQDKVKAIELLRLFRSFYRDGRDLEEVLETIGLTEKREAFVNKLSGGQRQRLAIGCALLSHPRVLFLDEPTTGLDPQARRRVWEIVEAFKQGGGTVILTTHYMEEAERLADDLVIVDRGKIIAEGSPAEIIASLQAENVIEFYADRPIAEETLAGLAGVVEVIGTEGTVRLSVSDSQAAITGLFEHARTEGLKIDGLSMHEATLEDVFVSMTGKQLRDDS